MSTTSFAKNVRALEAQRMGVGEVQSAIEIDHGGSETFRERDQFMKRGLVSAEIVCNDHWIFSSSQHFSGAANARQVSLYGWRLKPFLVRKPKLTLQLCLLKGHFETYDSAEKPSVHPSRASEPALSQSKGRTEEPVK